MTDALGQYLEDLDSLRTELRSADPGDSSNFGDLVNRFLDLLRISQRDLAARLAVTPPTVSRWVRGRNTPHPVMAQAIYAYLVESVSSEATEMKCLAERYETTTYSRRKKSSRTAIRQH